MSTVPEHHGLPMYRDIHRTDGTDMKRWLCTQPGCGTCVPYELLSKAREMAWADENGIALPGVTYSGGSGATG